MRRRPRAIPRRFALDASLWRRGFRPFFLATGVYAGFALLVWIAIWLGAMTAPT